MDHIEKYYDPGTNSCIINPDNFGIFVTSVKSTGLYWLLLKHLHFYK